MERAVCFGVALAAGHPALAAKRCPADSVLVGTTWVDRFEASVWLVPDPTTKNRGVVKKLTAGKATVGALVAAGATQIGCEPPPYGHAALPAEFPANGMRLARRGHRATSHSPACCRRGVS